MAFIDDTFAPYAIDILNIMCSLFERQGCKTESALIMHKIPLVDNIACVSEKLWHFGLDAEELKLWN